MIQWNKLWLLFVVRPTTKLVSDNTAAHLKISYLHYHLGEAEESLRYLKQALFIVGFIHLLITCREIRECLKLDPDHQSCYPHYKVLVII